MVSFATIKSLLIFFAPILLPRLLTLYRTANFSLRTRAPPTPLPAHAARALHILFASITTALLLSLPFTAYAPEANIFNLTRSRLTIPTDTLFSKLVYARPAGTLTALDERLQAKLRSPALRQLYLRFGTDAIANCEWCIPDDPSSYFIYHIPSKILLPHLLHILVLGAATSAPLVKSSIARWRNGFTFAALTLAMIDLYIVYTGTDLRGSHQPLTHPIPPKGQFWTLAILRPLTIAIFDILASALIYLTETNRNPFITNTTDDEANAEAALQQTKSQIQTLAQLSRQTQIVTSKARATTVIRNAIVRDRNLKSVDEEYWSVAFENEQGEGCVWEEQEVVRAVQGVVDVSGGGRIDVEGLEREAGAYVEGVMGSFGE